MSERLDYRFASDNTTGLCLEALAAFNQANAGRVAGYGSDPITEKAKQDIRDFFETDCDVHFVFSGTAANALSLSSLCRSYQAIFCVEGAHIDTGECGAPEFFTGGNKVVTVPGSGGKIDLKEFEKAANYSFGHHSPKPGALSLTQSADVGVVYQPEEIAALAQVAHAKEMGVHMDGARLANAIAARQARGGGTPAQITWKAGVDILSLGGTKNGMFAAEAVVLFNKAYAGDFGHRMTQAAQLNSKMRLVGSQWSAMLNTGAWLRNAAHANRMAALLEQEVRALSGVRLPVLRETNMLFLDHAPEAFSRMWAGGWRYYEFVKKRLYRTVCAWDTQPQDIRDFVAALKGAL